MSDKANETLFQIYLDINEYLEDHAKDPTTYGDLLDMMIAIRDDIADHFNFG